MIIIFYQPFYEIINLDNVNNIDDFYKHISCFDSKYQPALNSFKEQAMKNFEIVTMKRDLEIDLHNPESSIEWFQYICKELDINNVRYSFFNKNKKPPEGGFNEFIGR